MESFPCPVVTEIHTSASRSVVLDANETSSQHGEENADYKTHFPFPQTFDHPCSGCRIITHIVDWKHSIHSLLIHCAACAVTDNQYAASHLFFMRKMKWLYLEAFK